MADAGNDVSEGEDSSHSEDGYCHYNSNSDCLSFDIELFHIKLELAQNPAAGQDLGHVKVSLY